MRYFFSLAFAMPTLTLRIEVFAAPSGLILFPSTFDASTSGYFGAARLAILITPDTITADNDQGGTTGTVVESSAFHQHKRPMRAGFLPIKMPN